MKWVAFAVLVGLAACGANGAPEPVESGVAISGEARIGVTGSL